MVLSELIGEALEARAGQSVTDVAALYRKAAAPYLSWQRVASQDQRARELHDSELERLLLGNMLLMINGNDLVAASGLQGMALLEPWLWRTLWPDTDCRSAITERCADIAGHRGNAKDRVDQSPAHLHDG